MSTIIAPNPSLLKLNPFRSKSTITIINIPISQFCSNPPSLITTPQFRNPPIPKSLTRTRPSLASSSSVSDLSSVEAASEGQSLKCRLRNGETLYGLFLCSFCPTLAEIAGLSGYDFVVVDMEHGFGGIPEALSCLRALSATHTPAILRLPESSAVWAKKALDLGPQGIMLPMIDTPKEAKKAVSYCRYPPNGLRGAAHPIVRASGYGIDAGGYLGHCEEELLIMCQVESKDAVEKVEEIAAVDGVDCIQMGPLDLSASMGYLWDPGNTKVREVMRKAEKAVLGSMDKNGKGGKSSSGAYLSGFAMPHDSPQELKARGYQMVSGAVDVGLFRSAAVEDVKKFKLSLEMGHHLDSEEEDGNDAADDEKYWSE